MPSALGVDLAGGHQNSSDNGPSSRRRNENGKLERLGCRLRRHNDSSVYTLPPEQMLITAEAPTKIAVTSVVANDYLSSELWRQPY